MKRLGIQMKSPEIPENEQGRLSALQELDILDTGREERFDRLTRLASYVAGTPIALVSLVDQYRQWFKSRVGLDAEQTPRDISFCGHAILQPGVFEVPDAAQDPRFNDNPLVTGDPAIRFYAGVPLELESGHVVGTLCVIDQVPKTLSEQQQALLKDIAQAVVEELMLGNVLARARLQVRQGEQLRATLETVADGIITIDAGGIIQSVNPAALKLFGYQEGELVGRNVSILMPDPYRSQHDSYLQRYLQGAEPRVIGIGRDITGAKKDGSHFPMHLAVSEMRYEGKRFFTGVVHDTSAESRLREDLKESLELRQAILYSASVAIISTLPDGTILSFNRGAEELLGYRAEELIGKQRFELFHDPQEVADGAAALAEELGRSVEPGFEVFIARARLGEADRREWTYLHRDGSRIPVEQTVTALRSPSGAIKGFLGIAVDIRQRKDAERAKNEFISTVSHELRTPLTSLRGALGLLMSRFANDLPDKGRNLLENASRNSERLSLLINDILDLEKLEADRMDFEMTPGNLRAAVDQAIVSNLGYAEQFGVSLKLCGSSESAPALFDNHRIQQVLSNLISNAVKFSPEGSTVDIAVTASGDHWRVSVRDRGRGIPEAFRSQIFQRFSQADSSDAREKGGTGLGLSISRAIVDKHNGKIGFRAAEAGGTEFFFLLPRTDDVGFEASGESFSGGLPKVLVCSDNSNVADALCLMLNHNRFDGHQCPPEKLERMLSEKEYRALLLDFSHGVDTGLQLLRNIRSRETTQDLPVIVIAGQAKAEGMEARLQALNVYHWLQKPVDRKQLQQALVSSGRRSQGRPSLLHVEDDLDVVQIVKSVTEDLADYDYAGSIGEAREKLRAHAYDLVLLDLSLPDGDGRQLLGLTAPPTRVIVFSGEQIAVPAEGEIIASLVKSQVTNESLLRTLSSALRETDER